MIINSDKMRKISEQEKKQYIYDDLHICVNIIESVLIDNKFYTIKFSKGISNEEFNLHQFENKYFIEIIDFYYYKVQDRNERFHTNTEIESHNIYEVSKDYGNNIYKEIKATQRKSKDGYVYYTWRG
jgi:hypothetical protein